MAPTVNQGMTFSLREPSLELGTEASKWKTSKREKLMLVNFSNSIHTALLDMSGLELCMKITAVLRA